MANLMLQRIYRREQCRLTRLSILSRPVSVSKPVCLTKARRFTSSATAKSAEQSNFLETFISENKVPEIALKYFYSLGWARKVLQNPLYEPIPFFSSHLNEKTGENFFFARTISTDSTIPHVLALQPKALETLKTSGFSKDDNQQHVTETPENPDVLCFMALGPGLNAHPSIVHGGVQCVIFDEVMRLLVLLHQNKLRQSGPRDQHFTVKMCTTYVAPVVTPSDVLVRSWLVNREGRKWFARAQIVSSTGMVLTDAESIWVTARKSTPS